MRLIDADKVLAEFPVRRNHHDEKHGNMHFINGIEIVMEYLDEIADTFPIDAEPMRHGKWIKTRNDKFCNRDEECYCYDCSVCGYHTGDQASEFNYCPNCGAKMVEM